MLCFVKKRNKVLKTDFPVCLLPALECLNGTMDETLYPNPDPQKKQLLGLFEEQNLIFVYQSQL